MPRFFLPRIGDKHIIFPWRRDPTNEISKNRALLKLFAQLDREVSRFQKDTGLSCRPACSHCCENPAVETTTLELLPLAIHLYKKKEIDIWLARAEAVGRQGRCIFFAPARSSKGEGGCEVYSWRPLICRLFGFSATLNKRGRPVLVTCPVIKQSMPATVYPLQQDVLRRQKIPVMERYVRRLLSIDPMLGIEQIPINEAIYRALQKVGLAMEGFSKVNYNKTVHGVNR